MPYFQTTTDGAAGAQKDPRAQNSWLHDTKKSASGSTESTVTIILGGSGNSDTHVPKERPIWMSESTINSGKGAGEYLHFLRINPVQIFMMPFTALFLNRSVCFDFTHPSLSYKVGFIA